jgi:lipid II:glycine glycyltransferase (peptidoglycan interpeptide bridge formation enzyme)
MPLKILSKKEFTDFALSSPQITFHQTTEWADLKKYNGWDSYLLGLVKDDKVEAAALILSKKIPVLKKYMFYSPRGFLIDYHNKDLLKEFTAEIKIFAKSKEAIFIKIDPFQEYLERDNNGKIVDGGYNNIDCVNNLKDLGYKHFGFNIMQDTLQPRWMHVIDTENKTLDDINKDMESKTRQILHRNERCAIHSREINKEELPIYKTIMEHTSERRAFVDRPLSYYEHMWDTLHPSGILKILIAEIDFTEYKQNVLNELNTTKDSLKDRINKKENNLLKMNETKYEQNNKRDEETISRLENEISTIDSNIKEFGNKVTLGGILFLIYGNEVLSLYGGSEEKLMQFKSAYTLHYEGVKYAVLHHYKRYNFYGITGDFSKENPLYGLYLFKKSFGGHVVELIGEFDLIINPFFYKLYQVSFKTYHNLKNLKK